ncbi:MAG: hypothetical protein K1X75_17265 [Leptospirales bacterium]|nr:hypothetical protein [Leptospirales bacterium]
MKLCAFLVTAFVLATPAGALWAQQSPQLPTPMIQSPQSSGGGGRWLSTAAWALVGAGAAALVLALNRINRRRKPKDASTAAAPIPQAVVRDDHDAVAAPLQQEDEAALPEDAAVEQERWNLPGFLAVMAPVRTRLAPETQDFAAAVLRQPAGESLFDFRYYDFVDSGEFLESVSDLESFARSFLSSVSSALQDCDSLLFLRNRLGDMAPCLEKRGSVFVSGAALEDEHLERDCLTQLEAGRYVALEDGLRLVFPLPSHRGLIGALRFSSRRPLFRPEELALAWFRIRKFGEWLLQAAVFEQATVDRQSALNNGMTFHRDLRHEFALRDSLRERRELSLVQFLKGGGQTLWRGLQLRRRFGDRRLYRIAADVFALLGPQSMEGEIDRRFSEYLSDLGERETVELQIGCAILEDDVESPLEWFRRAGAALEQARSEGPNSFRVYAPVAPTAEFVEHGSFAG